MDKKLSLNEVIAYQCHVKGVTADGSCNVKNKGTFKGLIERIDYIKNLGVNQLVLLPVYDYEDKVSEIFGVPEGKEINCDKMLHNYWGFTKGDYYNLKKSYGSKADFKLLVNTAHEQNMEIVVMFHFEPEVNTEELLNVLKYWKEEFAVDGFFVNVNSYYFKMISDCSSLNDMKLYTYGIDENLNYTNPERIAVFDNSFRTTLRRLLKGEDGALQDYYNYLNHGGKIKKIISITGHNGFTLRDLYSYKRKHNEDNGEYNRDGEDVNYSDNFGFEGDCEDETVKQLRLKAMKNALYMLLVSNGVPMLLAGDEAGNSQNGNNNAYCQDNKIGWVQYDEAFSRILSRVIKETVLLRCSTDVFKREKSCSSSMVNKYTVPTLSIHTGEAWECGLDNFTKAAGLFYATDTSFLYIAVNFDKYEKKLSIPHLPKTYKWSMIARTDAENQMLKDKDDNLTGVILKSQSLMIFLGVI